MKKKVLILLGVAVSILLICGVVWYIRLPEFDVFQSYALSADNFRHDDVRVIVYKNHNDEEMFKRIEDEVNKFAGAPNTQITLRLFHSKREVIDGKEPYTIIEIDYEKDTYKITKD